MQTRMKRQQLFNAIQAQNKIAAISACNVLAPLVARNVRRPARRMQTLQAPRVTPSRRKNKKVEQGAAGDKRVLDINTHQRAHARRHRPV
jgi:hypothetical protein